MAKCDSGPGRNCKSDRSIKFRRDMHLTGFHIWTGLPNGTGFNQEMDNMFQTFKGDTDDKAQVIFTRKTYERAQKVREKKLDEAIVIPPAHLTNYDIPEMTNGKPGDPIKDHPFYNNFTPEKILKCFLAIGFTPFTQQGLKHKKVRHELGEGEASEGMAALLRKTQKDYE